MRGSSKVPGRIQIALKGLFSSPLPTRSVDPVGFVGDEIGITLERRLGWFVTTL